MAFGIVTVQQCLSINAGVVWDEVVSHIFSVAPAALSTVNNIIV